MAVPTAACSKNARRRRLTLVESRLHLFSLRNVAGDRNDAGNVMLLVAQRRLGGQKYPVPGGLLHGLCQAGFHHSLIVGHDGLALSGVEKLQIVLAEHLRAGLPIARRVAGLAMRTRPLRSLTSISAAVDSLAALRIALVRRSSPRVSAI